MSDDDQARADFKQHLIATGKPVDEAAAIADAIILSNFTVDGSLDTVKLHDFASRFNLTGTRTRPRNFGAGAGQNHAALRGQAGAGGGNGSLEAERRFCSKEDQAAAQQAQQRTRGPGAGDRRGGPAARGSGRGSAGSAEAERRYGQRS